VKVQRGYKTELRLNDKQRTACLKHAGAARYTYNWGLNQKKMAYENGEKTPNAYKMWRSQRKILLHTTIEQEDFSMVKKDRSDYYKAYRLANIDKLKEKDKCYYLEHREERLKKDLEYREGKREFLAKKQKDYYAANREKRQTYYAEYRQKNLDKITALRRERMKDPIQRLRLNLRNRLNAAVKNKQKSGSAVRDLGCTVEEFVKYIECKFQNGMTWENWGRKGWHLDHIKPISYFDLTDRQQFLEACHYTNIQPMWYKDNLSKGSKVVLQGRLVLLQDRAGGQVLPIQQDV